MPNNKKKKRNINECVKTKSPLITSSSSLTYYAVMILFLGIIVVLCYGIYVRDMGFYWDDWTFIYIIKKVGPSKYLGMLGLNRPILAWLYTFSSKLCGDQPLRWQIFGLFARWIAAISAWMFVKELWPKHNLQTSIMAFFFAAYPGFNQQYISVVYSHYFLIYALFLFSMLATIKAVRHRNLYWFMLSLTSSIISMLSIQYYFGLELARLLIIWFVLNSQELSAREKRTKMVTFGFPFILAMTTLLLWRFFVLPAPKYDVSLIQRVSQKPLGEILTLIQQIFQDVLVVTFSAWENPVNTLKLFNFGPEFDGRYKSIVFISGLFSVISLSIIAKFMQKTECETALAKNSEFAKDGLLLGGGMLFGAGWPFWVVSFNASLTFPEDRFTLPMIIGSSIFIVGLLELVIKSDKKKFVVVGMLIGFAAGHHYQVANSYSMEWRHQKRFLWQFVWRIPYLEPGTTILIDKFPFPYSDDEAMTSVINLIYRNDTDNNMDLLYGLLFVDTIESTDGDFSFSKDVSIHKEYGPVFFDGSTSQAIVVYYDSGQCLRILQPNYEYRWQIYPSELTRVMHLSDPTNILAVDDMVKHANLKKWYGEELGPTWCYYYEKAELARQLGEWDEVVNLGDRAFDVNLQYLALEELFPFIEGYLVTGNILRAEQLTLDVLMANSALQPHLCKIWERTSAKFERDDTIFINIHKILSDLECQPK